MDAAIELTADEIELLRRAASAPVACDSVMIRQRCLNLEARALLQRLARGADPVIRRPTFALTALGWRRLRMAVRRAPPAFTASRRSAARSSSTLFLVVD